MIFYILSSLIIILFIQIIREGRKMNRIAEDYKKSKLYQDGKK